MQILNNLLFDTMQTPLLDFSMSFDIKMSTFINKKLFDFKIAWQNIAS